MSGDITPEGALQELEEIIARQAKRIVELSETLKEKDREIEDGCKTIAELKEKVSDLEGWIKAARDHRKGFR